MELCSVISLTNMFTIFESLMCFFEKKNHFLAIFESQAIWVGVVNIRFSSYYDSKFNSKFFLPLALLLTCWWVLLILFKYKGVVGCHENKIRIQDNFCDNRLPKNVQRREIQNSKFILTFHNIFCTRASDPLHKTLFSPSFFGRTTSKQSGWRT